LKRFEDVTVPSIIRINETALPPVAVAPKICPIKQLLLVFEPWVPMQMTLLESVTDKPPKKPIPMLLKPLVLFESPA
jgi:hypothetical protein